MTATNILKNNKIKQDGSSGEPVTIPPSQIKTPSEQIRENKGRLIDFYINQQARLMDLKAQLKTAKSVDKTRIESMIYKIEHSDIKRAQIILKCRLGEEPSPEQLAAYLGKSVASLRGLILGQAYSKKVLENLPEILSGIASIDAEKFGENKDLVDELKKIQGKNVDLDQIAKQLKTSREKAADLAFSVWTAAQEIEGGKGLQKIEQDIDQQVAQELGVDTKETAQWLHDIEIEKQLGTQLTRLGEEKHQVYPSDFQEAAAQTFEKHELKTSTQGMWTFFQKGSAPPPVSTVEEAQHQWKLFLNPKSSEFQPTLDRALQALNSMPYINGKIVQSDTIKRKSEETVVEDPCEPKLLFYFNGPNSAEDFKKAVALLEKEFADADVIGASAGKRDQGKGVKEEQWGPSFTKERNRLMFYTQGGFTESGRDHAIAAGNLADHFEGQNYYLHKGAVDPLADLAPGTLSIGDFLNEMKANQQLFSQPLALIKLQNILNKLNKDPKPSTDVQEWKKDINYLMKQIASNMEIQRQQSMTELLGHWENMGDVNSAISKVFYKELDQNLAELDPSKGLIQAKLGYLEAECKNKIDLLESYLSNGKKLDLKEVMQNIPSSFHPIFMQAILEKSAIKDRLVEELVNEIKQKAKETQVTLSESALENIRKNLQNKAFLKMEDDKLVLVQTDRFWGGGSGDVPCKAAKTVRDSALNDGTAEMDKLIEALEKPGSKFLGILGKTGSKEEFFVSLSAANLDVKAGVEVALRKLNNVHARQQARLKAAQKGEAVVIPQYFHATNEKAASSIVNTGIESVQASSGFGAFFSTEPELRYGYVVLGLPKNVEFDSTAETIFDQQKAPHILKSNKQVWAGLKDLISINPRVANLQRNFSSSIQQAVSKGISGLSDLSYEKKVELEERLMQNFNRSVVFRPEMPADSSTQKAEQIGWSLNFRDFDWSSQPAGSPNKITSDEELKEWAENMIDRAVDQAKIAEDLKASLKKSLLKNFQANFKQAYQSAQGVNDNYVVKGQATEKLKACVIAADDEFKFLYEKDYQSKAKGGSAKEIKTLSEVEQEFANAGIGKDLIEFIPLSEQLIERDLLMQADAKVPKAWQEEIE